MTDKVYSKESKSNICDSNKPKAELLQPQVALEMNEAELKACYENIPMVMLLVDYQLRVRKLNQAAVSMTRRHQKEASIGLRGGDALRCVHAMEVPEGCGQGSSCEKCGIRNAVNITIQTGKSQKGVEGVFLYDDGIGPIELQVQVYTTPINIHGKNRVLICIEDISQRRKLEITSKNKEERLKSVLRVAPIGIGVVTDHKIDMVNEKFGEMLGFSQKELVGKKPKELFKSKKEFSSTMQKKYKQIQRNGTRTVETCWQRSDGSTINVLLSTTPLDANQKSKGFVYTALDITKRKSFERALKISEEKYRSLVENAQEAISVNQSGVLKFVNPKLCQVLGYEQSEVLFKPFIDFIHPEDRAFVYERYTQRLKGKKIPTEYNFRVLHKSGDTLWVDLKVIPIEWEGKPATLNFLNDITEKKQYMDKLYYLTTHDQLTKLFNREAFVDRLNLAIAGANRSGYNLAVLFIDLDNFKKVNDTFGHSTGDQLLKKYANSLIKCVRETDTVARLAGDEFIILLNNIGESKDVVLVVENIVAVTQQEIQVEKHKVRIGCSVGISIFPQDGNDTNTLINNADTAMYRAKNDEKQRYQFFKFK